MPRLSQQFPRKTTCLTVLVPFVLQAVAVEDFVDLEATSASGVAWQHRCCFCFLHCYRTRPLLDERAWTINVWQAEEIAEKSAAVLPAPLLMDHCCQPSRKAD